MKAVLYDRFGGPEVLRFADIETPEPGASEVLVKVRAISVNVVDNRTRAGLMGPLVSRKFPKIPGADLAGIVVSVGESAGRFKTGDEVFGAFDPMKGGACAEFASIPAGRLALKPREASFEEAASLPVAGLAALLSMRELGKVGPGSEVLVHGATGGVGLFAIQIAKSLGGRVTAVGGSAGLETARRLGAAVTVDHRTGTTPPGPYDVIFNGSGRMPFSAGRGFLKADGRLVEPSPTIPVFIGSRFANLFRSRKHLMLMTSPRSPDMERLGALLASGELKACISEIVPFADAASAFSRLEKGGAVGKIVVSFP